MNRNAAALLVSMAAASPWLRLASPGGLRETKEANISVVDSVQTLPAQQVPANTETDAGCRVHVMFEIFLKNFAG